MERANTALDTPNIPIYPAARPPLVRRPAHDVDQGLQAKMRDKLPAIKKLARHLGLDTRGKDETPRRIEVSGPPPSEPEPDDFEVAA